MERKKFTQRMKLLMLLLVSMISTVATGQSMVGYTFASNLSSTSGQAGTFSSTATGLAASGGWAVASDWTAGNKEFASTVISTLGYHTVNAQFYVKSTTNGPKNFTFQYKTSLEGSWQSSGLTYTCTTSQASKSITLPAGASNQPTLYLRWVQTSTNGVSTTIAAAGTSSINGISITATALLYPRLQSSDIRVLARTPTTITISWTKGGGTHPQMLMMNTINDFKPLPVNDQTFIPLVGNYTSGRQVIYNNTASNSPSTFTITVPDATTEYWFRVFDYEYNNGMERYGVDESAEVVDYAPRNPLRCALATIKLSTLSYGLITANIGATITNKVSSIVERGIYYSTTQGFNYEDPNTASLLGSDDVDVEGLFSFQNRLTDILISNDLRGRTIYYKAYVENDAGKIFTSESSFDNTPIFTGTGNWENASLWNVKEVPGANGDATYGSVDDSPIINGTCTLTASNNVTNLTINSAKKLTINKAVMLKVNGILTNNAGNSGILIKSRAVTDVDATGGLDSQYANGSLIFANGSPSGTVEMYSKANWNLSNAINNKYKWQFFTIPVKTMTAGSTFNFSSCYVREWDESVTKDEGGIWQKRNDGSTLYLSGSTSMNNTNGYEVVQENPKVYTFAGALQNTDFVKTLSYHSDAAYPGANIMGNPFTAAVDITKLTFGPNTEQSIYQYNTGTYTDWKDNTGRTISNIEAIITPGRYTATTKETGGNLGIIGEIPPMQGFLVKTTMNNETFTIPRSALVTNTKQQRVKTSTASTNKVATRIDVVGTRFSDCMWIFTDETCCRGFDNGWDARKMDDMPQVSQIYAMEVDGNYQINAVSDINESYLGFQPGEDTEFKLIFNHQNLEQHYSKLYLVDLVANFSIDISNNGSEYSFTSSPTDIVKRFKIISNPTGLNQNPLASKVSIYNNKNTIFINNTTNESGQVAIYNTLGHCLQVSTLEANKQNVLNTHLSLGAYIVKTTIGSEKVTQRIIVN